MSWFPINKNEIEIAEQQLKIALPPRYKQLLSDSRICSMLAHPKVGYLSQKYSMLDFVSITNDIRKTYPTFPKDGVVATADGRFLRFWLPNRKKPEVLGEVRYSWDTVEHKQKKDGTNEESVQMIVEVLYKIDPEFFLTLNYPVPQEYQEDESFIRARTSDKPLTTLLAECSEGNNEQATVVTDKWLHCADFNVKGSYLVPCDFCQIPEPSCWALRVTPSVYEVAVKVMKSSRKDYLIVSAVRFLMKGCSTYNNILVSSVAIDHAVLTVYDRQTFLKQVVTDDRDSFSEDLLLEEDLALAQSPFVAVVGRSAEFVGVPSGEGDGNYPIFALKNNGETVGMEIRFSM